MTVSLFSHRTGTLSLSRTAVMGILNVTPDSFSDGGCFAATDAAVARALAIENEGADLLDIGGQSTRPGHIRVSEAEEWARLAPILSALRGRLHIPISVDTDSPYVAQRALQNGASVLNDVSGSLQNGFPALAARYGAGLVMTAAVGDAAQEDPAAAVARVRAYFETALKTAAQSGLPQQRVCLDIGVGFEKSRRGDLAVVAALPALLRGLPPIAVMVGASRKRVIAACGVDAPPQERLAGTLALHTAAQLGGARILRVHDVAAAVQAARVTDALLQSGREQVRE